MSVTECPHCLRDLSTDDAEGIYCEHCGGNIMTKNPTTISPTALFHPYRVRIAQALIASEKPLSPVRIREDHMPDVSLGTVAYHVRVLKRERVIRLVKQTRVRGAVEHHYQIDSATAESSARRLHEHAKAMDMLADAIERTELSMPPITEEEANAEIQAMIDEARQRDLGSVVLDTKEVQ